MSGGRKPAGEEAEVEALLRAAQDAVLLTLQANSHLVSSSTSTASNLPAPLDSAPGALDDDLARRFEALKSRPAAPAKQPNMPATDEAEARFEALKGAPAAVGPEKARPEDLGDGESEEEEDEVEKVMRWAMDAARLDVATAGGGGATVDDKEEQEDDKSSVSSEEEEEERLELEMEKKRKEMMMSKNKPKNRCFFF